MSYRFVVLQVAHQASKKSKSASAQPEARAHGEVGANQKGAWCAPEVLIAGTAGGCDGSTCWWVAWPAQRIDKTVPKSELKSAPAQLVARAATSSFPDQPGVWQLHGMNSTAGIGGLDPLAVAARVGVGRMLVFGRVRGQLTFVLFSSCSSLRERVVHRGEHLCAARLCA